ncbi:MAG: POTRA domain-containing protein [Bacteroidales bacterium]
MIIFFFALFFTSQCQETESDTIKSGGFAIIKRIIFTGNKVTKEKIIRRELLFSEGDTIFNNNLDNILEQSQKNVMNTSLFNFVTIEPTNVEGEPYFIQVNVDVLEQWYIWPVPIFELADRNFNEWLKKMDWSRLNYGFFLTWNNFRGRRERLVVYSRFGYDEKYELSYQVPYINKKQTIGMGFSGGFAQNHEISYTSFDNKEVYYKNEEDHARREIFGYTELYYRKGIHNKHWFKLLYNDLRVADSVVIKNPDYMFGTGTQNQFFSFSYQYRSDHRDYAQYPLNGHYFDFGLDKRGLGIFKNPPVNTLSLKANIRKYVTIKGRFFWASGLTVKMSPLWDQPYYYMRGLGYGRDYVRGYEYYVVDAQHYGLLKNNLKFELIPRRVQEFKFIPTDKFNKLYYAFYLNVFCDLAYGIDNRDNVYNPMANEMLPGYGIGLDFVTYYNFVLRVEYSFNNRGESGFFISFMPSI